MVNYYEAISIMSQHDDSGVFVDNGWGDDPDGVRYYWIIKDGNGQNPLGEIDRLTFKQLLDNKIIAPNSLRTYKDRQYHAFKH